MSSVLDTTNCPQCGYDEADVHFDCGDSSWDLMCRTCGYREHSGPDCDQNGQDRGWKHEINKGFGAAWYRPTGAKAFVLHTLHSTEDVVGAERALREQLSTGGIEADTAYLSRWNDNTQQVEMVLGTFYQRPEGGK